MGRMRWSGLWSIRAHTLKLLNLIWHALITTFGVMALLLVLLVHKVQADTQLDSVNNHYYHYNYPSQYWHPDYIQDRPKCEFNIDADDPRNHSPKGNLIQSPVYETSYPEGIKCSYTFITSGDTRTQIIFTQFDLFLPPTAELDAGDTWGNPQYSRCFEKFDHVSVSVEVNGKQSVIDVFCGQITPPQMMSAKNIMTVEFITHFYPDFNTSEHRGFQFLYKFVDNFGIDIGIREKGQPCYFLLNAEESSNGTIYSPNYPGYYPRNTDCYYEFQGKPHQQVAIHFTYFHVEGYGQCQNTTESDYVLFSNFRTVDRKNIRYCGDNKPDKVTSEKNYLRMIFHANNIFDATGFFALYQFTEKPKKTLNQVKHRTSSGNFVTWNTNYAIMVCVTNWLLLLLSVG